MMEIVQDNIGGALGGAISVIVGAALYMKRMKPTFALDDKVVAAAAADNGIVDRLEKESKRLAEQNDVLAGSVNRLQLETIKLSTENSKLHMEILGLREENAELRRENKEMRKERDELMEEMAGLKNDMKEMTALIQDLLSKKP